MSLTELKKTYWKHAADIDDTVYATKAELNKLSRREICEQRYSRQKLFDHISSQRVVVFRDFPLRESMGRFFLHNRSPEESMKSLFSKKETTLTKSGPSQRRGYKRVHDVVDAWHKNTAILSANDVFYRDLELDSDFDCESIGDFSVLREAPDGIRDIEVATLLMGTYGCMSDSHADDPDGSNYCIRGRKFWLIWDRQEGSKKGLEDCEYDEVYSKAHFDIKTFLTLKTSAWFTLSEGQTLFLPGNYTHKVITIEKYMGISNFYVCFSNALTSLTRWKCHSAPNPMVSKDYWGDITQLVIKQFDKLLKAKRDKKNYWGFYHIPKALRYWETHCSKSEQLQMLECPHFKELIERFTFKMGGHHRRDK